MDGVGARFVGRFGGFGSSFVGALLPKPTAKKVNKINGWTSGTGVLSVLSLYV
jgi:hypothetical protein